MSINVKNPLFKRNSNEIESSLKDLGFTKVSNVNKGSDEIESSLRELGFSKGKQLQQQEQEDVRKPHNILYEALKNASLDVLTGAAEGGKMMHDLPYNTAKLLDQLYGLAGKKTYLHEYVPDILKPIEEISGIEGAKQGDLNIAKAFGAPEGLAHSLIRGAVSGIPFYGVGRIPGVGSFISNAIKGKVAPYALTGALTGLAASNDENPLANVALGGSLGAATAVLPDAISILKKAKTNLGYSTRSANSEIKNTVNDIKDTLSGGLELEKSGKQLASSLKDIYKNTTNSFKNRFENLGLNVNPKINSEKIYPNVDNTYKNIFNTISEDNPEYLSNVHRYSNDFLSEPTLANSNILRKQLNKDILRSVRSQDWNKVTELNRLEKSLNHDVRSFYAYKDSLSEGKTNLLNDFDAIFKDYKNEVIPYRDPQQAGLNKLSTSIENPKASEIKSAFEHPSTFVKNVFNKLPEKEQNRVVYSDLFHDQIGNKIDTKKLINDYLLSKNKGFAEYHSPSLDDQFNRLLNQVNNLERHSSNQANVKKALKYASVALGGGFGINKLSKMLTNRDEI